MLSCVDACIWLSLLVLNIVDAAEGLGAHEEQLSPVPVEVVGGMVGFGVFLCVCATVTFCFKHGRARGQPALLIAHEQGASTKGNKYMKRLERERLGQAQEHAADASTLSRLQAAEVRMGKDGLPSTKDENMTGQPRGSRVDIHRV